MAIFVDASTKVIVQGLTGGQGRFHGLRNRDYGTQIVAGVTPGKGGQDVEGIPVFDSVAEAVGATGATASFVSVPPKAAPGAILEAGAAGVALVVCITEGIPAHDEARVFNTLKRNHPTTRLLGPNCPGIISPGQCNIGITPGEIAKGGGPVGIVSRSGTLTYQALYELKQKDIGVTTCVGIGGDPVPGTSFIDCLAAFEEDDEHARGDHVRRDRRIGRGGSRGVHCQGDEQAGRRLRGRCHCAAGAKDGARGCDHQRLEGHCPGEDGRARRRGRQGRAEPDGGGRSHGRGRRQPLTRLAVGYRKRMRRGLIGFIALLLVAGLVGAVAVEDRTSESPTRQLAASTTTTSSTTSTTLPPTTTTEAPGPATIGPDTRLVMTPSGIIAPVATVHADGAVTVKTPCENLTLVRGARPVGTPAVVLDPGHGGREPGATGANGLPEKALNLAVTQHVERALIKAGVAVVLTRGADYRMTLSARAAFVAAAQPKIFVSVHHNGESDGPRDGPGTEVFYQHRSPEARRLGGLIYEEVVKALSQYQVAWQADRDAGVKTRINTSGGDYYAMLRQTAGTPSVLAELAFLSNPPEAELLARPDVQAVEGEAVARGIVRYLRTDDPGSGYTEAYPRTSPAGSGGGRTGCVDPPMG